MEGSSNFEDDIFIVVTPLYLQRHKSHAYYNSMQCTFMLVIFPCAINFFLFPPFHNPSLLQYHLLKMCRTVEFLHPLRLPAVQYLLMSEPHGITIKINMQFNKTLNSHTVWRTYLHILVGSPLLFFLFFILFTLFVRYIICIWSHVFCNIHL